MTLVETEEPKFSVQHFVVFVLVVINCLFNSFCPTALEVTCPTECTCGNGSLACSNLGLEEILTTNLAEHVLSFYFSHNKLTYLKDFAFRDYLVLDYLDLSYNQIEIVYSECFHGLAKLKYIDLSHNNLDYFAPNIFSDNHVLETVSFRGNRLVYLPGSPPILASHSITSLDLSNCSLTSINADTFSQLPNLTALNLNYNLLHEIDWDHLEPLRELINLDLRNNRWICDCKILEVLNKISNRRTSMNMDGEVEPVKCYKGGEYEIIRTAGIKEYCTEEAEKERNKFLESKPEERPVKETSTIFVPMEDMDKTHNRIYDLILGFFIGFAFSFCVISVLAMIWIFGMLKKLESLLIDNLTTVVIICIVSSFCCLPVLTMKWVKKKMWDEFKSCISPRTERIK